MAKFVFHPSRHYDVYFVSREFPLERHLGRLKGLPNGSALRRVITRLIDTPSRYVYRVVEVETDAQVYYVYTGNTLRRVASVKF